jgi:DNA-binding transcriptional LysR family regulator
MKLHLLRYFSVLADELHFGRAADKLAITQPPLSSAIKALEDELGVQLLVRSSKNVELTPAGAAFLEEARYILERVDRAASVARSVASGMRGRLDVGMTSSLLYRELPAIVSEFGREMPGIDLVLHELSTVEQLDGLVHGQIQAGFVNASTVPPQLEAMALHADHFVLCLPACHPRAGAAVIALRELADEKFIMFSRDVSPTNHDNVIAILSSAGIHPKTQHAARQWLTVVAMVAQGLGIAVVPSSLARSRVEGARFVPFGGAPADAPAVLVWNAQQSNPALAGFLKIAAATIALQRPPPG